MKYLTLLALMVVFAVGCGKPVSKCTAPEDNAPHHYVRGMELLADNKADDAAAKFERSLYCDEEFSQAHGGLAIAQALKAVSKNDVGYKKVDADKAAEHLKQADKKTDTDEDKFSVHVAEMRVQTILKRGKWLSEAQGHYKDAMKIKVDDKKLLYYDGREAAIYYMGIAYLDARELQKARDMFSDVLAEKAASKWNAPAEKGWKRVDKILRAMAGKTAGDVGKQIALRDSVNRGELSALLIEELKIDKLFAGRIASKSASDKMKAEFTPADTMNTPFKDDILTLMKWNIRGLEPVYDETTKAYLFKPDAPVSRKDLAFALEDVLAKITGDEAIATKFIGNDKSPFPDVHASAAWFNAAMNMTTRGLMETELSGDFRPNEPIDGAEALLAIRVLKHALNVQ
ncbi:MAG: S-layer homology domain-containing protein [Deltaproteobacteria bacterium]|nr:S-layer homology domain-containing protein [Deltaproteobacteria bacterium]